ncbi:hypothetical protein [Cellulophaga sp. BC115SP]|uniref:hypothetical protein n=1 Tax=Cellulophaga sp. BC115SP TaxID=2683263 RepID=UPI0014122B2E|nr:hypothetical protein [Cellulophaga sp. BC115SP]NBB30683.1 hypothetical protein [Cellulophaga sp. BC115SP]
MNTLAKSRQERNTNAGAGFLTSTYFSLDSIQRKSFQNLTIVLTFIIGSTFVK